MGNSPARKISGEISDNLKRLTLTLKYLLPVLCALLVVSCAGTSITNAWKDRAYQGKAKKMAIIMVAKDADRRQLFEGRLSAELEERGNDAVPSFTFATMEQLPDRELMKSKIKGLGSDTVLVSRLVDTKTIEAYRPGLIHTVPDFYLGWGSYYTVVFADYGYTTSVPVVYVETNLYDVKTEKLIWSARTKMERTEGEQQLINQFCRVIIKKLKSDGIIR